MPLATLPLRGWASTMNGLVLSLACLRRYKASLFFQASIHLLITQMDTLKNLPASLPGLYDPSFSLKLVGVAGKYDRPEVGRRPDMLTSGPVDSHARAHRSRQWRVPSLQE
jgi:hypothetical protein